MRDRPVPETTLYAGRSHCLRSAYYFHEGIWVIVAGNWLFKGKLELYRILPCIICSCATRAPPFLCALYMGLCKHRAHVQCASLFFPQKFGQKIAHCTWQNMVYFYMTSAILKMWEASQQMSMGFFFSSQAAGLQLLPQHP